MGRYRFIDSLRGAAATAVVLFHVNEVGIFPSTPYQVAVKHGALGVPVFFVISGFVVYSALLRSTRATTFLAKRVWRIYPPYLVSLVLTVLVILVAKLLTGTNSLATLPADPGGWLAILTLTASPITPVGTLNWVYWSLTCEIVYYFVLAFTLAIPALRWWILFGLTLAALTVPTQHVVLNNWPVFALGAALAEATTKRGWLPLLLAALVGAHLLLRLSPDVALTAVVTAVLIWCCTRPWGAWLNHEPLLSRIGDWSYSLYLVHVPVAAWVVIPLIEAYPRALSASDFGRHVSIDLIAYAASTFVAILMWVFVERPSMSLPRIQWTTMRNGRGAAP